MLQVRNLDVEIDGTQILNLVDLDVDNGEIVGLLGPSGSGKSTLLRAIAGIVEPTGGTVSWDGKDVTRDPTHLRRFGLMFQGFALFPHLTVAENIGFSLAKDSKDQISEALGWVGMSGFENRTIDDLSGGEKQRVALVRTLAPEPRFVMLDEPVGALDRNLRERLVAETRNLLSERSATGIVVTHDRDEATALSDRLALMRDGQIIQTGTLDSILADPVDGWVTEFLG